jgi:hypothetical protein
VATLGLDCDLSVHISGIDIGPDGDVADSASGTTAEASVKKGG